MEKRISYSQFQSVKAVAKACNPLVTKKKVVVNKILKLKQELEDYDTQISALEQGIRKIVGYPVDQLVKKVIETDAKGNKITKYLPTDMVSYDEQTKEYVINDGMEADNTTETPEVPTTEAAGSDFDADQENTDSQQVTEELTDNVEPADETKGWNTDAPFL